MDLVSGTDNIHSAVTRDQDSVVTAFGPFTLTRNGPMGALSQISDGTADTTTSYGYDALARIATRNHFAMRDYEPDSGRWTARDPVLFDAGPGNLYAYAGNSPISHRDPTGLFCVSVSVYDGIGGGFTSCSTKEGASACGEGGVGVGSTVAVDGGGLDSYGAQIVGEVTVASRLRSRVVSRRNSRKLANSMAPAGRSLRRLSWKPAL